MIVKVVPECVYEVDGLLMTGRVFEVTGKQYCTESQH